MTRTNRATTQASTAAYFAAVLRAAGLPAPEAEHRFHPVRRWRFDFAWPEHRVALEVEGAVWARGRHVRPAGFLGDMEKYNTAAAAGWLVLRCTPQTQCTTATLGLIRAALQHREERTDG